MGTAFVHLPLGNVRLHDASGPQLTFEQWLRSIRGLRVLRRYDLFEGEGAVHTLVIRKVADTVKIPTCRLIDLDDAPANRAFALD